MTKGKFDKNPKFQFVKFFKTNNTSRMKVLPKRFHLNGRTIGFCPQT